MGQHRSVFSPGIALGAFVGGVAWLGVYLAAAGAWAAGAGKAPPVVPGDSALYRDCMVLVAKNPKQAFEHALAWHSTGGGYPARHCIASALQALGQHAEAAARLQKIAIDMKAAPVALRAKILQQAAGAWLRAKQRARALAALKTAIKLDPGNLTLRSDRGLILALSGKLFEAVDDFNKIIEAEPRNVDVLVLRAASYRRLKSIALARDDLKRALAIAPNHPDALLERGILRLARKDRKGARADWIRILQVAPKSAAAGIARAKLAKYNLNAK
ncbi:MAG: tetratricopeptide repeat protein [Alphaproteobacteria bacterium]